MREGAAMVVITQYLNDVHRQGVIELWASAFGYEAAHNEPNLAIDRKLAVADGLFFVALAQGEVMGTSMAGYDGHRGWLYSVAVHAEHRRRGVGAALVRHTEAALVALGCVKINLQIADGNEQVAGFYETLGYACEPRVSMGKKIAANIPGG
jgi:ribosomal protein S18 acetylase RimI-like enzyme